MTGWRRRLRDFSRAQEANFNCNRWVALRVDFVTALVSLCAGIIAVFKSRDTSGPAWLAFR